MSFYKILIESDKWISHFYQANI